MKDNKGKTAHVTGAGTGISRATSLMLGRLGVNIAVNYAHSEGDAKSLQKELDRIGVQSLLCKASVSKDDQVKKNGTGGAGSIRPNRFPSEQRRCHSLR